MADVTDGVINTDVDMEDPGRGYPTALRCGVPEPYYYGEIDLDLEEPVYGYCLPDDVYRLQMMVWFGVFALGKIARADLMAYWHRLAQDEGRVGFCVDPRVDLRAKCDASSCRGPIVHLSQEAFTFVNWKGLIRGARHVAHKLSHLLQHARGWAGEQADHDQLEEQARIHARVGTREVQDYLEGLLPKKAQRPFWPAR